MSVPFYAKIDKAASDLLKADDFDLNRKVSVKSKGLGGDATFTFGVTSKDVKKNANFSDEGEDRTETNANLKAEFKNKQYGEITGEVDALQLISLTWKTPQFSFLPSGLKFEVKGKHDRVWDKKQDDNTKQWSKTYKLDCFLSDEVQYVQDNLAVTAAFKAANSKAKDKFADYSIAATGVLKFNSFLFGAEFENDFAIPKKQDFAIAYNGNGYTFVGKTAKLVSEASLSFHHAVLPKVAVAGAAKYVFSGGKKSYNFGISHDIDDSSAIRATIGVDAKSATVSALYSSVLNKYTKLSLSSIINAKQLAGGDHKVGIKLEVGEL